jgi:hypothetical protein
MSRKNLSIGCLLIGAVLLITPSIAFAQSASTYTNTSGENATVNVTNNQWGANFTVLAAGSPGLYIPFVSSYNTANGGLNEHQSWYTYSVGGFIVGSSGQGIYTEYPQGPAAYQTQPGYYYPGSDYLQYGCLKSYAGTCTSTGYETLYSYLNSLHSTYMFTGLGANDKVTLTGGLTADTYSITTPGAGVYVTINSGLGNSTYNIVLGQSGVLTINAVASTAAYNYYNVVY